MNDFSHIRKVRTTCESTRLWSGGVRDTVHRKSFVFLRVDRTRDCLQSLETIEDFPEVTLLALHVAVQYMAILSQIHTQCHMRCYCTMSIGWAAVW